MSETGPSACFSAFDRNVREGENPNQWEYGGGFDQAAALLDGFDASDWLRVERALFDPACDPDWKERCCQVLGFGPIAPAAAIAVRGLLSGDAAFMVMSADLLRDWRPELVPPIPPQAIEAVRRLSQTVANEGDRLALEAFLTWAGAR